MEHKIVETTKERTLYKRDINIIPSVETFQCYIMELRFIMLGYTQAYRITLLCTENV
jgi:hypothetical protein